MRRMFRALLFDILFQFRHGFYYAYAVVTVLYIIGVRLLPGMFKTHALIFVLFSDTGIFGFFIVGAIVLLERSQNTLQAVFVTPLRLTEYFIAKSVSLGLLAIGATVFLLIGAGVPVRNVVLLVAGVFFSSVLFTLMGFGLAAYSRSFNHFLLISIGYLMVFLLPPFIDYFGIFTFPVFYLFPTKAVLILLKGGFGTIGPGELVYSLVYLCLWCAASAFFARSWFVKYIIEGGRA